MDKPDEVTDKRLAGPADHLANERTFLAWIRTSLALMGFGFVIVKFVLFLREISEAISNKVTTPGKGYSEIIGVTMVIMGAIIAALAYFRYQNVEKQLNKNLYSPSQWLSATIAFFILIGSVLLVLYLISNL